MRIDIDALTRLRALVKKSGTKTAAAKALGVTPSMVTNLLNGRRVFSNAMLAKLGLRRTVIESRTA